MCGGCGCCQLNYCFSNLLYIFEKFSAWLAVACIMSCIVFTVMISIALGVGIGYNYAYVDQKVIKIEQDALEEAKVMTADPPPKYQDQPASEDVVSDVRSGQSVYSGRANPSGFSARLSFLTNLPAILPVTSTLSAYPPTLAVSYYEPSVGSTSVNNNAMGIPSIPSILGIPAIPKVPVIPPVLSKPAVSSPPSVPLVSASFAPTSDQKVSTETSDFDLPADYESRLGAVYSEVRNRAEATENIIDEPQRRKANYKRRRPTRPRKKKFSTKSRITQMPTILIPLQGQPNLSPLLSKILGQKKNVTLQFITI